MSTTPTLLESLGLDEPYPGMCEDTYPNKRVLRANKLHWFTVTVDTDGDGYVSMLKPHTPESLTAEHNSTWENRKPIMVDPENRFSEFVGPQDYPQDFTYMPWWVQQRLTWWIDVQLGRKSAASKAYGKPFPTRCKLVRHEGTRCWNWVSDPSKTDRCGVHAGWTQDDAKLRNAQIARSKLLDAAPDLADNMIDLAMNAEGEAVRLKASETILAISGIRAGQDLNVKVEADAGPDPAETVRERLDRLARSAAASLPPATPPAAEPPEDIVEAEVIEVVEEKRES